MDIIENKEIKLYPKKTLNAFTFYNFIDKKLELYAIPNDETEKELKNRNTKVFDIINVKNKINDFNDSLEENDTIKKELSSKQKIFTDVYDTLLESHYDKDNLSEDKLVN
jgi:galactokinase/mevalonate kinase-like predicted kinase